MKYMPPPPPPIGIETTVPKSERPQIHALDRASIGINICLTTVINQTAHCYCVMEFNIPLILPTLIQNDHLIGFLVSY